jgi:hypothetical protein
MAAAITSFADPREGLQNYILGGKRGAPTDVPKQLAPSQRLANDVPIEQPKAPSTIPSSSARPGKRTNDRIPYARYALASATHGKRLGTIRAGELVFVHKTSNSLGHGTNRCTHVATVGALNAMLATPKHGATSFEAGKSLDAMRDRIVAARAENGIYMDPPLTIDDIIPAFDWPALTTLEEFTLDGVAINTDPGEHDAAALGIANDLLVNVAIAGPTPCRNVQIGNGDVNGAQIFDLTRNVNVLDDLYVGLFAKYIFDENTGALARIAYEYELFGSQTYASATAMPSDTERPAMAWRVGRVMDKRLVGDFGDRNHHVLVNVCVEQLTQIDLICTFFPFAIVDEFALSLAIRDGLNDPISHHMQAHLREQYGAKRVNDVLNMESASATLVAAWKAMVRERDAAFAPTTSYVPIDIKSLEEQSEKWWANFYDTEQIKALTALGGDGTNIPMVRVIMQREDARAFLECCLDKIMADGYGEAKKDSSGLAYDEVDFGGLGSETGSETGSEDEDEDEGETTPKPKATGARPRFASRAERGLHAALSRISFGKKLKR